MRYPGREQQVMELFRKNPRSAEMLRGPIFEDKVVDFILELASITDEQVEPEALSETEAEAEPPATAAPVSKAKSAAAEQVEPGLAETQQEAQEPRAADEPA